MPINPESQESVPTITTEELGRQLNTRTTIQVSLSSDTLVIDMTKVELCLLKFRQSLEPRVSWTTPVSLVVAVIATLATTSFKDALGVPAAAWQAVFIMALILSGLWSAVSIIRAVQTRRGSIESIIAEMKREAKQVSH